MSQSNPHIDTDFFRLFTGEVIGSGAYRTVYQHEQDEDLVIKKESGSHDFSNIIEWETWWTVKETSHAKWFAPCVAISPCGIFLIQKKAKPISAAQLPDRIPNYFTDLFIGNWGMYDKHPVCVDYGSNLLMTKGLTKRMRKMRDKDWYLE